MLLYRIAENRRRRPRPSDPNYVRYASAFSAMQMGRRLLATLGNPQKIGHQDFARAQAEIEADGDVLFQASLDDIDRALRDLYGDREISLQQLAATFRRADLIDRLEAIDTSTPLAAD